MGIPEPKNLIENFKAVWAIRGVIMMISPVLLAIAVVLLVFAPEWLIDLASWLPYAIAVLAVGNIFAEWGFALRVQRETRAEGEKLAQAAREEGEKLVHAADEENKRVREEYEDKIRSIERGLWELYPPDRCVVLYHQHAASLTTTEKEWVATVRLGVLNVSPWKVTVDTARLAVTTDGADFVTRTLEPPGGKYDLLPGESLLVVVTAESTSFGLAKTNADRTAGKLYVPLWSPGEVEVCLNGTAAKVGMVAGDPPTWAECKCLDSDGQ